MAIPFLGEIERLINEHGSATILRERIALANEQYTALEQKHATLNNENETLKAENKRLRFDNTQLQHEIGNLKKVAEVHVLDPSEIEMMKFIGNKKSAKASDIVSGMSMHSVHVEHFLGRLLKGGYLDQQHVPMLGAMYSLSDKGNAYLVENDLVG